MPDYWLEVRIRKVLRPATSTQVFLGFPVSKRMLRWFPRLQVAIACFSCSPPNLNLLGPYFIFMYVHNNHCRRATAHLQLNIIIIIIIIIIEFFTSQLWQGNIHLSWNVVINGIRLGGLTCSLKSFLQLNMCQELQIFAVVYMYWGAS